MPELPVAKPEADNVGETGRMIAEIFDNTTSNIAASLNTVTALIANNPKHTPEQFWERQGVSGAQLLQFFGKFRALLADVALEKVSDAVAAAGSTLIVDQQTGIVSLAPTE